MLSVWGLGGLGVRVLGLGVSGGLGFWGLGSLGFRVYWLGFGV